MNRIGVFGGINTDFVFSADRFPKESETIMGNSFTMSFGGKGANKAVAISRLGGSVKIFGGVGDDDISKKTVENLVSQGVDTSPLKVCDGCTGGVAGIYTTSSTNEIVVIKGANACTDSQYIDSVFDSIKTCDVVVAEFEAPVLAVEHLAEICHKNGIMFVLNPSPVAEISKSLIDSSDYIVVNEIEIKQMGDFASVEDALKHYKGKLILTKGADGVYYYADGRVKHIPAINTKVVDTTGAGDTFLGAFLYKFDGSNIDFALFFANIVAGLKITKIGAQTGMPTLAEVEKFIEENNLSL